MRMRRFVLATLLAMGLTTSAAQAVSGKLVIYTSQPNKDAQQTVDAFIGDNPGVGIGRAHV